MKQTLHKIITYILAAIIIVTQCAHGPFSSITTHAATTSMANVVIFVDFQDTDHSKHNGSYIGECFLENSQTTMDLFNGSDTVNTGMAKYLDAISYGQFQQINIFPQYDKQTGTISTFTAANNASAYKGTDSSALVSEMIAMLEKSGLLIEDADLNDDGLIDNLTLVAAYTATDEDENDVFISHKSYYGGEDTVGGLRVGNYNLVTESGGYLGLQESAVFIHEFLHTLGYPDLYKVGDTNNSGSPVGTWDIMSNANYRLQYPLAYLRSHYTGWFSIPTITEDVTGYSIYSASAATDATKNNQAIILKTDYSDTEFFVVEYRHTGSIYMSTAYDNYIYGSGLIVYRVNTKQEKNMAGNTDHIYLFRPGDTYNSNGYEACEGDLTTSFLSLESGRTSYGSSDYEATLSDGAITYSDGTNSGIVISNVGSATGDTITFDVTFGDGGESLGGFWDTKTTLDITNLSDVDSCMDDQGNIYVVAGLSAATATGTLGGFEVYKYDTAGNWSKLGSKVSVNGGHHKIVHTSGGLYVACIDYGNSRANLYEYSDGWTRVHRSDNEALEFDLATDGAKVYMAYTTPSYSGTSYAYCESYYLGGVVNLGSANTGSYLCNPILLMHDGQPVVVTRDFMLGNAIGVSRYSKATSSWSQFANKLYADSVAAQINGDTLYLMKNGNGQGAYQDSYVYSLDLADLNSVWTKLGANAFTDNSAVPMSMFFDKDVIYLTYQNGEINSQDVYVKTLENNKWETVGTKVTRDGILAMNGHVYDDTIYLVYGNNISGITIKTHAEAENPDSVGDGGGSGGGGDSNDDTGNTGGTTNGTGSTGGTGNAGGDSGTAESFVAPDINISYRTHVQTYGWEGVASDLKTWKTNGAMSGTSGKSKRLEGINIVVNTATSCPDLNLGIQYTTHCQSYGWLPWSANGQMNGTEGEAKRLEAIMIKLTGDHANLYDVYYRVHAQTYGWLGWAKNGEPSGTAGYRKRLEGIQIVVVKKGESFDKNMGNITSKNSKPFVAKEGSSPIVNYPATSNTNPVVPGDDRANVTYRTHVQSFGWQGWKYNGQMSGTSGKSKRLEGINIELRNQKYSGDIVYTTHVQKYGWKDGKPEDTTRASWKKNGQMSGTSGEAKRLEAICIDLTGQMKEQYDIYYRVHAQSYGWLGWAKNGERSGTAGCAKRLEGIQIVLVPKGSAGPENTYMGVTSKYTQAFISK